MRERSARTTRGWLGAAISIVAVTLAIVGAPAMAQDEDLPGRVGRLADFAGQVLSSSQDRPDEWEPIGINYPITSGLNLWVSSDGRAEVDYGGGQFRLAGNTNVHIARLDDREVTLFVAQGSVVVRVRVQDPGETTRIDTPNTQLALLRPGLYRVEVAPDRQATTLIVREGEGNVAVPSEVRQLLPGQAVTVPAGDSHHLGRSLCARRRRFRYVEREPGQALRGSARFRLRVAPDGRRFGSRPIRRLAKPSGIRAVWFPNAAAPNWAPYSDGYWVDIGGWGPTWVDSAPWGYAPFHYGRWAFIGGRWGWCPGRLRRASRCGRRRWSRGTAVPGWGVGVAGGRPLYGWVPLGWREPYYPGWRGCSGNCWARYNRPYGVNVADRPSGPPARHVNLAVPGALSAVPASSLAGRAPVRSNLVSIPRDLATSAAPMRTIPQMRTGERQVPNAPSTPSAATNVPARLRPMRERRGPNRLRPRRLGP
jgi:mannose-6-phosphate isomerase-like protein (cupin superfamily)